MKQKLFTTRILWYTRAIRFGRRTKSAKLFHHNNRLITSDTVSPRPPKMEQPWERTHRVALTNFVELSCTVIPIFESLVRFNLVRARYDRQSSHQYLRTRFLTKEKVRIQSSNRHKIEPTLLICRLVYFESHLSVISNDSSARRYHAGLTFITICFIAQFSTETLARGNRLRTGRTKCRVCQTRPPKFKSECVHSCMCVCPNSELILGRDEMRNTSDTHFLCPVLCERGCTQIQSSSIFCLSTECSKGRIENRKHKHWQFL